MNREQILHIVKENESLKMKEQRLQQSIERLQSRYNDAENDLNRTRRNYDSLRDQFKEIVRNAFPRDYIDLKMRDFNEVQLYEFILKRVNELEQSTFYNGEENTKLKNELAQMMSEMERLKNAGPMISSQTPSFDSDEEGEVRVDGESLVDKPTPVGADENPVAGIMSIIEDKDWPVIKAIGEGETLFSKISEILGIANSTVNNILTELTAKGVVNFEKIQKGGKGRPAHHYFLTPLGTKAFELKFGEKAETTMLEKMSTHGSPSHGGLMVEVGKFLSDNGCDVDYDGPDTTFRLKDGRDIIFDLVAYDPESKEQMYIETERAKCGDQHLQEKFDKCFQFTKLGKTKTIHVVAPDKNALHQIQQQLFRWVRKKSDSLVMLQKNNEDKALIIFKTSTLEDFKKGKLQTFYYGGK